MSQVLELVSAIYSAVANIVLGFVDPTLTIRADLPGILELDSNGLLTSATRADVVVALNGRPVASFNAIQAIQVQHWKTGGGQRGREWWTLHLQILGRSAVFLGKSRDALEVSTAAARLSALVERPVVSLSQAGLRTTRIET